MHCYSVILKKRIQSIDRLLSMYSTYIQYMATARQMPYFPRLVTRYGVWMKVFFSKSYIYWVIKLTNRAENFTIAKYLNVYTETSIIAWFDNITDLNNIALHSIHWPSFLLRQRRFSVVCHEWKWWVSHLAELYFHSPIATKWTAVDTRQGCCDEWIFTSFLRRSLSTIQVGGWLFKTDSLFLQIGTVLF